MDDESINREILGNMLNSEYEVVYAENGKQALEKLSEDKDFSLMLLDLRMPVMGGLQVLSKCRSDSELSKLPIIVLTQEKKASARGRTILLKSPTTCPR